MIEYLQVRRLPVTAHCGSIRMSEQRFYWDRTIPQRLVPQSLTYMIAHMFRRIRYISGVP